MWRKIYGLTFNARNLWYLMWEHTSWARNFVRKSHQWKFLYKLVKKLRNRPQKINIIHAFSLEQLDKSWRACLFITNIEQETCGVQDDIQKLILRNSNKYGQFLGIKISWISNKITSLSSFCLINGSMQFQILSLSFYDHENGLNTWKIVGCSW